MLRNGEYKMAKDLTQEDSLMPLYRKHSEIGGKIIIKGYEMVFDPSMHYYIFTHLFDSFSSDEFIFDYLCVFFKM